MALYPSARTVSHKCNRNFPLMPNFFQEIKPELSVHCAAYRELEEERRLGWESSHVDHLWQARKQRLDRPNGDRGRGPNNDKYFDFYKTTLPRQAGDVFTVDSNRRFLDIGCAPGGLSRFLCNSLGWSGRGVSLDPAEGGLELRFVPREGQFKFTYANVASPDFIPYMQSQGILQSKYDFINLGVVIGGHQVQEELETSLLLLSVTRNSFQLLHESLKPGADAMWIFPSTNAGAWLYFLDKLRLVFDGSCSLFNTLVPSRSPVYAVFRGFRPDNGLDWLEELSSPISPDLIDRWNYKTWREAEECMGHLSAQLNAVWRKQRKALEEIRVNAAVLKEAPDVSFARLSGGKANEGRVDKVIHSSRADKDLDWRRR